ncbi:hypothetical protein [Nocardia lijiangensis]|uniref:hypothetical protein n=1 Tax=Nocardia lijiangensis TaxID=299618 RepID=UPI003D75A919
MELLSVVEAGTGYYVSAISSGLQSPSPRQDVDPEREQGDTGHAQIGCVEETGRDSTLDELTNHMVDLMANDASRRGARE